MTGAAAAGPDSLPKTVRFSCLFRTRTGMFMTKEKETINH